MEGGWERDRLTSHSETQRQTDRGQRGRDRERQRQREEERETERGRRRRRRRRRRRNVQTDKNRNNNSNKTTIKVDPKYPPNLTSISPRVYRGGGRHNRQIGTPVSTTARAQVGNLAPCFHLTHVLHGYCRPLSTTATTKRFQSPRYRTVTYVDF